MHRKASWLLRGLMGLVVFGVACGQCDKDEAVVDAGVAVVAAVDAGSVAQVETTAPVPRARPDAGDLVERLSKLKQVVPGAAYHMSSVPQPTEEEMANPRYQHLPEAARRSIIIFQKMQAKVPSLYAPTKGKLDPIVDEDAFIKKWKAKQQGKRKSR
jgi:hypothetical protein